MPSGPVTESSAVETILTLLLMFVILCVVTGAKEKGVIVGTAVGAVVGLEALFAGPIAGTSMNSARLFGPTLLAGHLDSLWTYLLAPDLGGSLAVLVYRSVQEPGYCCTLQPSREEIV